MVASKARVWLCPLLGKPRETIEEYRLISLRAFDLVSGVPVNSDPLAASMLVKYMARAQVCR